MVQAVAAARSNQRISPSSRSGTFVPKFLAMDQKVLSFDAFFLEAVHESVSENYRVRRCVLFYYLEDGTLQISEPKIENSGLPQGCFLKRHKVLRDASRSNVTHTDLNIGKNLTLYGRTFHIVSTDAFTKSFLQDECDIDVPEPESFPADTFFNAAALAAGKLKPDMFFGKQQNSMKIFMEASLGKFIRAPEDLKHFLDHDRHVLRYFASWDDTARLYGHTHRYTIHYFLADNTMEIREDYDRNSGCDHYPKLLNRMRLEKCPHFISPHATDDVQSNLTLGPEAYYAWQDLAIGASLIVYNRSLTILDADVSTRKWYRQHDVTLGEPLSLAPPPMPVKPYVPPPNTSGIGSEEDSLASCFSLCPKPFKVIDNFNTQLLRFSAQLRTTKPEDVLREFVLTYFVASGQLKVMEPPMRNSGIGGGRFLDKKRHVKPTDGSFYGPLDFYLGAAVPIAGHVFLLSGVDEYTLKYMEAHPNEYPTSNMGRILTHLSDRMQRSERHQASFRAACADTPRGSYKKVTQLLRDLWPGMVTHEITTVMRYYGAGVSDSICLHTLWTDVSTTGQSTQAQSSHPQSTPRSSAMMSLASELLSPSSTSLLQSFRLQDVALRGTVSRHAFGDTLTHLHCSKADIQMVSAFLWQDADVPEEVDYLAVLATLNALSL